MYYGTEMKALNFGIRGHISRSRWKNICWNHHCTGGGIQYSTYHVELDFLVEYSMPETALLAFTTPLGGGISYELILDDLALSYIHLVVYRNTSASVGLDRQWVRSFMKSQVCFTSAEIRLWFYHCLSV